MKKILLTAFAGFAATLLYTPAANATTPAITLSLSETGFATATASGVGSTMYVGSYGDFIANVVTGLGTPPLTSPYLNLQTVNISATSLSASHTLTIELTETGLTATQTVFPITSFFTGILSGVSSETVTSYYDPNNGQFATTNMLDTTTFFPTGASSSNQTAVENISNLSSPFSETEVITATFMPTGSTPDSLNSSAVLQAAAITTPEPASLALIGSGLLGLALVRRRRSA